MDSVMENYTYLGVGRNDGKLAGEFAPVFYDSTRVKLLSANTIWLSETIRYCFNRLGCRIAKNLFLWFI
jgi:hypothetical protein